MLMLMLMLQQMDSLLRPRAVHVRQGSELGGGEGSGQGVVPTGCCGSRPLWGEKRELGVLPLPSSTTSLPIPEVNRLLISYDKVSYKNHRQYDFLRFIESSLK